MNRDVFTCIFAEEICLYLDYKVNSGYLEKSFFYHLKNFNNFCNYNNLNTPIFPRELADKWLEQRDTEISTTYYSRINAIKHFLKYLNIKGYDVIITRDVKFKASQYKPHVYSSREVQKYFLAVDTFETAKNKMVKIQYPILFRILYCCGTRINETLGIRKKDVDLTNGIIKLFETKNNNERYIVLNDQLNSLLKEFANKCFYLLNDDDYIFTSANGNHCCQKTIYLHHRLFLKKADIPFIGNNEGPRIHDWRTTFAVNSFKQMFDLGLDFYVALPILSTYLGHKTIYATEKYLRLTMEHYPQIEEKFADKIKMIFGDDNNENN